MEAEAFSALVTSMMSENAEVREPAEKAYDELSKALKATYLFALFKVDTVPTETRSFCLILLRRLLTASWSEIWPAWDAGVQAQFKGDLLTVVQATPDKTLRRRLADVIAEVARNSLDENSGEQTWPEVYQFVPTAAMSDDPQLKIVAMTIFESVPQLFGASQSLQYDGIKAMFRNNMSHTEPEVRSTAVKAFTAFLGDNDEDDKLMKVFQELIPDFLKAVTATIETEEDDDSALQCLCDLALTTPKILRTNLPLICEICLKTVSDSNRDESFRHSALEVLITLCESSPPMMRKSAAAYLPSLIEQCLALMCDIEEDEDWYVTDQVLEDDDDDNATVGEASLDRMATALGGKAVWPLAKQRIAQLLANTQQWQHRHAAIMALSCIGEGCKKSMEPSISEIVSGIVPYLTDQHARVRHAACNAIGQMSSDFAQTLQKKCHAAVVPALLSTMADVTCPRVAAHAGAAMVNFSEECPKHILVVYLEQTMSTIEQVLQHTYQALQEAAGKKYLLEQVVTTMASVADTVEDKFTPYYDRTMPFLKHVLTNANSKELRLLRGKTIECMSLIGLAVGSDKFMPDASDIMQVLLAAQQQMGAAGDEEDSADDPQMSYMMSAWARICKLMGEQFAQYLPLVMPPVMKAAAHKPDITVCDSEDTDEGGEQDDWQFVHLGDNQSFGIRTAGLEEKATACEMLVCYARELKHHFVEYVDEVATLMIPLLKFYFNDQVRSSASEIMPYLLSASEPRGQPYVMSLWEKIYPELCAAVEKDPETDVRAEHLGALAKCIDVLGVQALDTNRMQTLCQLINTLFTKHFERCDELAKQRTEEDYDEEAEQTLKDDTEMETEVMGRVSDVWHSIFSKCGDAAVPYFESQLPLMLRMFEAGRLPIEQQWMICIFDDLFEFATGSCLRLSSHIVPHMIAGLSCDAGEVRQACSYGLGVMAMKAPNDYTAVCTQAFPNLITAIEREDARSSAENTSCTDNCIAAVAKILKYGAAPVNDAIIARFVSWLPTFDDKEESAHIYDYLCHLVETNNSVVMGADHSNIPHIVRILMTALCKEAFDDSELSGNVKQRIATICVTLKDNVALMQACASQLDTEQQNMFTTIVNA